MRCALFIFFLSFCLSVLSAQEERFIFIQADNNQAFYVAINGKLYSYTAKEYIIVPKLTDGNYNITVGFAHNAFPEQSFQCVINSKDLGFNLKNYGEKGWGLLNLQSLNISMAESGKTDEISKVLSEKNALKDEPEPVITFNRKKKVISEPALSQNTADTMVQKTINSERQKIQEETPNTAITENTNTAISEDIKKVLESTMADGMHLAYIEGDSKTDTINIIIPSDEFIAENSAGTDTFPTKAIPSEDIAATDDSAKSPDSDTDKPATNATLESLPPPNVASVMTNSKCKDIATDEEYIKLRKKMAMQSSDVKMINEAKKIYRNKCFTTRQVKSLSTLFLSDEGRYDFFNASYNSVTDVSQYYILESEFIDPAFVSRFKALLQ